MMSKIQRQRNLFPSFQLLWNNLPRRSYRLFFMLKATYISTIIQLLWDRKCLNATQMICVGIIEIIYGEKGYRFVLNFLKAIQMVCVGIMPMNFPLRSFPRKYCPWATNLSNILHQHNMRRKTEPIILAIWEGCQKSQVVVGLSDQYLKYPQPTWYDIRRNMISIWSSLLFLGANLSN